MDLESLEKFFESKNISYKLRTNEKLRKQFIMLMDRKTLINYLKSDRKLIQEIMQSKNKYLIFLIESEDEKVLDIIFRTPGLRELIATYISRLKFFSKL